MSLFGRLLGRPQPENALTRPVMEGGDAFARQLARHLVAQAFGEGDISRIGDFGVNRRDTFIRFTPLARAVNIISALCAQMLCNGGLTVRDREDRKVMNRRVDRILELLSHSPDGGLTPAHSFVEDVMADYLLDGNGLVRPITSMPMMPIGLVRYRPQGAYTVMDDGPLTYWAQPALSFNQEEQLIPGRDMIHIRWPLLRSDRLGASARQHFAVAPVTQFAQAMLIGLMQDAYVNKRFGNAPTAQLLVGYDKDMLPKLPTPEQRKEITETVAEQVADSPVLLAWGVEGRELSASPVHEHVIEARSQQTEEVARIYGLPLPLLSAPIGQWTRGVNEQVMKMAWRTGIRPHLDRFLSAFATRLLLPGERFEVDPSEFVRGDAAAIAELINATQGDSQRNPVASRAELRHAAGWPREPDGEIRDTVKPDTPDIPQDSS